MTGENISILSTIANFLLAVAKLFVGLWIRSAALIADGIHSGLDILSSLVTFWGTKKAKKPADKEHPYGHYRSETIASFLVVVLLVASAIWIIYEGVAVILSGEEGQIGFWAILIASGSIVVNFVMTSLKMKAGKRDRNLALIGDAKHSRADAISSIAVLVGIILARWIPLADGLTAIFVAVFILYESWVLGREVINSLMDTRNLEVEKKIEKLCQEQEIPLLDIRTRETGAKIFAELKVGMNPEWQVKKVSEVSHSIENFLKGKIPELDLVVIQIESHDFQPQYLQKRPEDFGSKSSELKEMIPSKKGRRFIIPISGDKIAPTFGAKRYQLVDIHKGRVVNKKNIENLFFHLGRSHGIQILELAKADEVIVREIGSGAKSRLKVLGIKIRKIDSEKNVEQIISDLRRNL